MATDYSKTDKFSFWGDYAEEYTADAVSQGYAEVTEVTSRVVRHTGFLGTGAAARTERTAPVRVTKEGFARPGPQGSTEAVVGCTGTCPADWIDPEKMPEV